MRRIVTIIIAFSVILAVSLLSVYAKNLSEREKGILEEGNKTKIINTEGLKTSNEYTAYDYYLESLSDEERQKMEAKRLNIYDNESLEAAKTKSIWKDAEPKDDYEREFFPSVEKERLLAIEMRQLINLIEEETDNELKEQYQKEYDKLFEEFTKQSMISDGIKEKYNRTEE